MAIHELLSDPNFDDGLTPGNPDTNITAQPNGETVNITITKIYGGGSLQGQALTLTKEVSPATAPVNTATTFTYTITIDNQGGDAVTLEQVVDNLPPDFSYVEGSTSGFITSDPDANSTGADCGSNSYILTWDLSPYVQVGAGEELTLTFQAAATLSDGTYYNQVHARYDPWWTSPEIEIYTPYTAPVTVGTGTPKCGYGGALYVEKSVTPDQPFPGESTITYDINIENWGEDTRYVCVITDLLPPTFSYKAGSSSGITTADPTSTWDTDYDRWELDWRNPADGNGDFPPLITVAPGQTKTQTFQATADIQTDTTYFNEVRVVYSNGNDVDNCRKALEPSDGGTIHGGASSSGSAASAPMYDIRAVSLGGEVLSRVIVSRSQAQVYIMSWQED